MQLTDDIDRRAGLTRADFAREYLSPPRPVILTDALSHWRALGRWSPQFFKTEYGHLEVQVDGERMTLRELVDRIEASSEDHPAPYLRNQPLGRVAARAHRRRVAHAGLHAAQLVPEPVLSGARRHVGPGGVHRRSRRPIPGAALRQLAHPCVPHAALRREGISRLQPRAELRPCTPGTAAAAICRRLDDLDDPDLTRFPLFDHARGVRFRLGPGEMLFVPAGWWHTARILSPSVTVSINGLNRANSRAFRKDYCAAVAAAVEVAQLRRPRQSRAGREARLFELK